MFRRLTILTAIILMAAFTAVAANHKFTLVIDAGHGGHDAGALGAFSKEKDINLRTALAFGKYVESNCPDVNVIYTRKTDVFVTLYNRAEIANKAKADLFISIHTNSLPKGHIARGFETYTLGMHRASDNLDVAKRENSVILVEKDYKERYEGFDPNSAESYIIFEFMQDNNMARSVELAKLVQTNACRAAGRPDKGVKQAGFLVLRETSMPSCLIELGFISTPDEEKFLNTSAGIDNLAQGIYKAFAAYKKKYDTNPHAVAPPTDAAPAKDNDEKAQSATRANDEGREQATSEANSTKKAGKRDKQEAKSAQQEPKPVQQEPKPAKQEAKPAKEDSKPIQQDATSAGDAPVYKVQIFVTDKPLKPTDSRLKGHKEAGYYSENGLLKYTLGDTTDYKEILQTRKNLAKDFPDAFVIAFKDGQKISVSEARKVK